MTFIPHIAILPYYHHLPHLHFHFTLHSYPQKKNFFSIKKTMVWYSHNHPLTDKMFTKYFTIFFFVNTKSSHTLQLYTISTYINSLYGYGQFFVPRLHYLHIYLFPHRNHSLSYHSYFTMKLQSHLLFDHTFNVLLDHWSHPTQLFWSPWSSYPNYQDSRKFLSPSDGTYAWTTQL